MGGFPPPGTWLTLGDEHVAVRWHGGCTYQVWIAGREVDAFTASDRFGAPFRPWHALRAMARHLDEMGYR